MSDRPILFSGPMVRALLDGRKTQTRRVLNPQPSDLFKLAAGELRDYNGTTDIPLQGVRFTKGNRLYVREAWRAQEAFDDLSPVEIGEAFSAEHGQPWCPVFHEADGKADGTSIEQWQESALGRLRQGMHMPRWASRITLIVTDVRVQCLQEISEEDARAEGCFVGKATGRVFTNFTSMRLGGDEWANARDWYAGLWDQLNARRGYGWDVNPWVIAISFTVERQNIDQVRP